MLTAPSGLTVGGGGHGRLAGLSASPVRSAAARLPEEMPSQPSTGQVLELTDRATSAAEAPSRSRTHRFGVVFSSTSDQLMPPVPTRTTAPAGSSKDAVWVDAAGLAAAGTLAAGAADVGAADVAAAGDAEAHATAPRRTPAVRATRATTTATALRNTGTPYGRLP